MYKIPKILVNVVPFEKWNYSEDEKFDMIYSAQAFHLIDANIKYKKCFDLLKDKGYIVLFWYNPSNEKLQSTKKIEDKVDKIIEKFLLLL